MIHCYSGTPMDLPFSPDSNRKVLVSLSLSLTNNFFMSQYVQYTSEVLHRSCDDGTVLIQTADSRGIKLWIFKSCMARCGNKLRLYFCLVSFHQTFLGKNQISFAIATWREQSVSHFQFKNDFDSCLVSIENIAYETSLSHSLQRQKCMLLQRFGSKVCLIILGTI